MASCCLVHTAARCAPTIVGYSSDRMQQTSSVFAGTYRINFNQVDRLCRCHLHRTRILPGENGGRGDFGRTGTWGGDGRWTFLEDRVGSGDSTDRVSGPQSSLGVRRPALRDGVFPGPGRQKAVAVLAIVYD